MIIIHIIRPPVYSSNGRSYKMLVMLFLTRHRCSELPRPIAVKLCHMIGNWLSFIMQSKNSGSAPPQKFGGQKHAKFRSILYNLRLWSRISPEWLKISKIRKLRYQDRFLLRSKKKVRWTLVHQLLKSWCEFVPIKMDILGDYISAFRGCCAVKILHPLEIDQALLARTPTGTPPQKKFNCKN